MPSFCCLHFVCTQFVMSKNASGMVQVLNFGEGGAHGDFPLKHNTKAARIRASRAFMASRSSPKDSSYMHNDRV